MPSPIRTIQSPGYEGREIDLSTRTVFPVGTSVMVMGYANKGEAYEPLNISSTSDLEVNFGTPTNAAERYFYYACKEVLNENGTLVAAKIPYSNSLDQNYKYVPINLGSEKTLFELSGALPEISGAIVDPNGPLSGSTTISGFMDVSVGNVSDISNDEYDVLAAGGGNSNIATSAEFVIVNERKTKITGPNSDEGIFITVVDPIHGMLVQRSITDPTSPDSDVMALFNVESAKVATGELSASTFVPNLTATYSGSSVSEDMMKYFPAIDFVQDGSQLSNEYSNWLTVIVSRTIANPNNNGDLEVSILEAWNGSVKTDAEDTATGRSVYIGDIINNNSSYIKWYASNPQAQPLTSVNNQLALYVGKQNIDLASFTQTEGSPIIEGREVVNNVKTVLEKVSNIDERQIDIVLDGGLSTIAQYCTKSGGEQFKPAIQNTASSWNEIDSGDDVTYWRALVTELDNFCKNVRKDCMAIVDGPRNLVIEGEQKYIRKTKPSYTFSNRIGNRLKYITGINSSYVAIYTNWVRVLDTYSGNNVWMPPSIKAAGIYVRTDTVANYWDAPAGLNRGIIGGVNDIAFNPRVKEADQLYIKSFNYAKQYPLDGFILEGQKTSQVKPSAFDRVNVRRLFLRLERAVYLVSRYYIYQPNNEFTRSQLTAAVEPIFQSVKAQGGLYDYRIVCDETNNTATVIDNNELRIAIALKPVRTAEFILADFIATRTDTSFDEVL
jgi:hypothetical protein